MKLNNCNNFNALMKPKKDGDNTVVGKKGKGVYITQIQKSHLTSFLPFGCERVYNKYILSIVVYLTRQIICTKGSTS